MTIRIGQGFDTHRFEEGDHLQIGGVSIPFTHSFAAHSDGDVLLHAITDALLGAAGMADIGTLFPDTDPQYRGADSRQLLREVVEKITEKGWQVVNLDSTLVAEAPKMMPYIPTMRSHIASDLNITVDRVAVKASTSEKMGFIGRGEGVVALAVVLLSRSSLLS